MKVFFNVFMGIIITIFLFSFTLSTTFGEDDFPTDSDIPSPVQSAPVEQKPKIILLEPTNVVTLGGREKVFDLSIKNVTSFYAYGVFSQVSDIGTAPVTASFVENTAFLNGLGGNTTGALKLKLTTANDAKPGVYSITILTTYRSNDNKEFETKSILQVRVDNPIGTPNLVISDFTSSKNIILPNESFTVKAKIQNSSINNAKDVTVSVDGLKSNEIYLQSTTNIIDFPSFNGNTSKEITLDLTSSPQIKAGSYPIILKLKYFDKENVKYEKDYTYYVNIGGDQASTQAKPEIQITNISAPSQNIEVGVDFSMTLDVKNTSSKDAKNIKITALPAGEGAVVAKSTSIQQIPLLKAGETKKLTFKFAPTATSKTQNYTVGYTLEYETGILLADDKKEIISFTQYQGVNVKNYEADKKPEPTKDPKDEKIEVPKIIIKQYTSNPVIVSAGREFDLSMTFLNTNKDKTIQNVKVYLTAAETTEKKGNVFSPVNSSNTFFMQSIPPNGEVTKKLRFFTVPDADPKTYTILVNFEYEDSLHNEYKSSEIVGINVKQITKLDIGNLNVPEEIMLNEPTFISFQFYNTGKVTLSNLMVKLEGNFEIDAPSRYYGSFNPSVEDSFDANIIATEIGPINGKILISYEDDSGEKIETPIEFSSKVIEPMIDMNAGMIMGPNGELMMPGEEIKKPGFDIMSIVKNPFFYVGIVVVIVIIVFVTKKIKKKRSMDFNE